MQEIDMKAVATAVIERWLTPGYRANHPAETAAGVEMLERADPSGYVAACAAVRDMDQRALLSKITVLALVLTGTHDPVTPPSDARFLTEHIPGSRVVLEAECPRCLRSDVSNRIFQRLDQSIDGSRIAFQAKRPRGLRADSGVLVVQALNQSVH